MRWKIKKYNEAKSEIFTTKILADKGEPDLSGMVDKLVKSVKTGEPTVDEIEAAEALKAVANIKPTEAFLEAEANGESSDEGDSKAPKRKSRNKD